ncbi:MAG TPA: hypothetical protein VMN43_07845 [Aestuariivirgaceae bacterium]|nr:hypothetical protein [Aestuariivirgaceae bacterium]
MQPISDEEIKAQFLAWQCRIRQMAMRQHGGRPTPGMRPRVLTSAGEVILPAMTILIIPADPHESTAFFRFQLQKTADPRQVYERALTFLQSEHYSVAAEFSDQMTALFRPNSVTAAELVRARQCLLEFAQYSQTWRMSCAVRRLPARSPARQATLWHNRAFNRDIPGDATVLSFKPDWRSASPSPLPPGFAAGPAGS